VLDLLERDAAPPGKNGAVINGARRALFRLGAAAGIAGPAAFTAAWIVSALRQTRQGPGGLQLSGLAAPDARDPWPGVPGPGHRAARAGTAVPPRPRWRPWAPWLLAGAAATGVILIAYATDVTGPAAATLQRVAVTLPQAAIAAIAATLLRRDRGRRAFVDMGGDRRPARRQGS